MRRETKRTFAAEDGDPVFPASALAAVTAQRPASLRARRPVHTAQRLEGATKSGLRARAAKVQSAAVQRRPRQREAGAPPQLSRRDFGRHSRTTTAPHAQAAGRERPDRSHCAAVSSRLLPNSSPVLQASGSLAVRPPWGGRRRETAVGSATPPAAALETPATLKATSDTQPPTAARLQTRAVLVPHSTPVRPYTSEPLAASAPTSVEHPTSSLAAKAAENDGAWSGRSVMAATLTNSSTLCAGPTPHDQGAHQHLAPQGLPPADVQPLLDHTRVGVVVRKPVAPQQYRKEFVEFFSHGLAQLTRTAEHEADRLTPAQQQMRVCLDAGLVPLPLAAVVRDPAVLNFRFATYPISPAAYVSHQPMPSSQPRPHRVVWHFCCSGHYLGDTYLKAMAAGARVAPQVLNLQNCRVGPSGPVFLNRMPVHRLQYLNLAQNKIGPGGCRALSTCLITVGQVCDGARSRLGPWS